MTENTVEVSTSAVNGYFRMVPIAEIRPSATNPRKKFDQAKLTDLAESIRTKGVIQPVVIRPKAGETPYELVAGERRWRASKQAGVEVLPAMSKTSAVLPIGHAQLIAKLQSNDQVEVLKECVREQYGRYGKGAEMVAVTLRQLRGYIDEKILLKLSAAPWKKKDADLVPEAGSCHDCKKSTGANALLFPEFGKMDRCTDPECYEKKLAAFIDVQISDIRTNTGQEPPKLSVSWYGGKSGENDPLNASEYTVIDKQSRQCDCIELGVYVDGDKRGRKQQICRTAACPVHGKTMSRGRATTPEDLARQEAAREAERQDYTTRMEIVSATVKAFREREHNLPLDMLRLLAAFSIEHGHNSENRKTMCRRRLGHDRDAPGSLQQWIDKNARPGDLWELIAESLLIHHFKPQAWYDYQEYFANRRSDGEFDEIAAIEQEAEETQRRTSGPELKSGPDYLKQIASCFGVDHEAIAASVRRIFEERRVERKTRKTAKEFARQRKVERQKTNETTAQHAHEQPVRSE